MAEELEELEEGTRKEVLSYIDQAIKKAEKQKKGEKVTH